MISDNLNWLRSIQNNLPGLDFRRSGELNLVGCAGQRRGLWSSLVPHLRVERVEGGLMVAGVPIASSCQVALPVSGFIFIIIGTILSVIAYQGQSGDEDQESYVSRITNSTNSRVLGPVCLAIGLLFLTAGVLVCLLDKYARSKEQKVCFHCPIHGDFFPLAPIPISAVTGRKPSMFCAHGCPAAPPEPPPCPYSHLASARNSVSSQGSCPTPKPFIINNSVRCMEYFWPLTVNNDIASFPVSRTPSPTPVYYVTDTENNLQVPMVCTTLPEVRLVAPATVTDKDNNQLVVSNDNNKEETADDKKEPEHSADKSAVVDIVEIKDETTNNNPPTNGMFM